MSKVKNGAPLPVQVAIGVALAVGGLFFAFSLAGEAGVVDSIWFLLLLATFAGLALAWLNELVERGRSPRSLALPACLLLGTSGAALANSLAEDNQVWVGLAAYAAAVAWVSVCVWRIAASSGGGGGPGSVDAEPPRLGPSVE